MFLSRFIELLAAQSDHPTDASQKEIAAFLDTLTREQLNIIGKWSVTISQQTADAISKKFRGGRRLPATSPDR